MSVAAARRGTADPHPAIVYNDDILTLPNPPFAAPFLVFNTLMVEDLGIDERLDSWFLLQLRLLARPLAPFVDLVAATGEEAAPGLTEAIGAALIGLSVGQTIEFQTPGGRWRSRTVWC